MALKQFPDTSWRLSRILTRKVVIAVSVAAGITVVAIVIAVAVSLSLSGDKYYGPYSYKEVLHKSILFYEAQRSGKLPSTNRIPWRGDSALNDSGVNGEDLSGGWYDAGDHLKSTYTIAYTTSVLAWGFLEFRHAYDEVEETDYMLDCLKWGTDFLLKAHTDDYELYVQLGDKDIDHKYWGRPEEMTMERPPYRVNTSVPGSDVAGSTSAALASVSLAYLDKDANYSKRLLDAAKVLFEFADTYRGFFREAFEDPEAKSVYTTGDHYTDEIGWAAIWLYKATGEEYYLNKTLVEYESMIGGRAWAFAWGQVDPGVHLLLYNATGDSEFHKRVTKYIDEWLPGGKIKYTPKGLVYRDGWGSLRYAATTSFLALAAAQNGINVDEYRKFAKSQIDYMLGDTGRSYVGGFGRHPPVYQHHRSSSCPDPPAKCAWNVFEDTEPNAQTLYGGLVGGPDQNDDYEDIRADYYKNEVAIDYNAGFQSAVAGLLHLDIIEH
ncbi:endoglucanase E-4-like [Glandiceps talaboti]